MSSTNQEKKKHERKIKQPTFNYKNNLINIMYSKISLTLDIVIYSCVISQTVKLQIMHYLLE